MKLIIRDNKVIGWADDDYEGPEGFLQAPEGFDTENGHRYLVIDGQLILQKPLLVSKFQGKAALLQAGLLADVEALVADPATDPLVVLAWNDVTEFRRLSPMIAGIASALGWTDEQLDSLFEAAALISA